MQEQNPYLADASRRPIVLSRKQLSVDARTGLPRVTRKAYPEPKPIDDGQLRQRIRNLRRAGSVEEADRLQKVYESRKARG